VIFVGTRGVSEIYVPPNSMPNHYCLVFFSICASTAATGVNKHIGILMISYAKRSDVLSVATRMSNEIPVPPNIMPDHHYLAFSSIFTSATVIQSKLHQNDICNIQCGKCSDVVSGAARTSSEIPALPNIMLDHHYFAFSSIFAHAAVIQSKLHYNEILVKNTVKCSEIW
jgi:hypothetical protein